MGRGFRTQQDTGPCFLPCCPSVFIFLPPQLRFPGPSFEHSSANIRSSLGRPSHGPARLAAPQPWRNPSSLQPGFTLPHSPTSAAGSKVGEAGSIERVILAARHAHRPAQLALACPCPASHLLSLQHPAAFSQGREDHLPILNTIPFLSPSLLSGLMAHLLLHRDNRGQSTSQHASYFEPQSRGRGTPLFVWVLLLMSSVPSPHSLDPEWSLICVSVCVATSPSRFFPSACKNP